MADIRFFAPASRARHSPRPEAKVASPEGRLRADTRAPWTRGREYPRIVDRVESWWRHAGCEPAQERQWAASADCARATLVSKADHANVKAMITS